MHPMTNSSSWITEETWKCLLSLIGLYFSWNTIDLITDEDSTILLQQLKRTVYVSNEFIVGKKPHKLNTIIVSENLTDFYIPGQYGRVVVITTNLEPLLPLWTKFRVADLVVLVPEESKVKAYTWYPFRPSTCHNPPKLEYIDECSKKKWHKNLFPAKIPKSFSKCPIRYKTINWPPDIVENPPNSGNFSGREIVFMKVLAESLGFQIQYAPTTSDFYNQDLTSGTSAMRMLHEGEIDFAFATMAMLVEFYEIAEPLPSYRDDPTVWMFPKPNPKKGTSSIYTGFSHEMWILIVSTLFASSLFMIAVSRVEHCDWRWLNLIALLVASPVYHSRSLLLRVFVMALQFYSLHIAWFYQSVLLKNLFYTPMEKQISSLKEAVESGLNGQLLIWLTSYFNTSDHNSWNELLSPGRFNYAVLLNYDLAVVNKTSFLMALLNKDGAIMRLKYRDNLNQLVHVEPFFVNKVAMYGIRGSPLIPVFTHQMLYLLESGTLTHLTALEPGYVDLYSRKRDGDAKVLDLEHLFGAFMLIFAGLFCSGLIFLAEMYMKYRQSKKNLMEIRTTEKWKPGLPSVLK